MIATLPAVQFSCKRARRIVCTPPGSIEKRIANRRHRRALNLATRRMTQDPERFDSETFHAPSLSIWDLC